MLAYGAPMEQWRICRYPFVSSLLFRPFFFYFCVWTPSPSRERYLYCSFPIISLFCVISFEEPVQHVYGSCQKKKRSRGAFIGSIVGGAMPPCSDAACAVFFFFIPSK